MPSVRQICHRLLGDLGITTIFGNPGSNELPFLAELPEGFRYVLGLHEGAVIAMADGYAQATGRPTLVNLHAASGSGNAMGALTNAVYSRTPLVLSAGQQVRSVIGMEGMLANADATQLMRPLVGWSGEPACATDVPRSLAQATFEAQLQRRPSYLSIPYDDWDVELDDAAARVVERRVRASSRAGEADLDWLTERLRTSANPALVLGGDIDSGGHFATAVRFAERLGCPVWAAPSLWRLPFPNRHPQFRGVLPAGVAPISAALAEHDLVLVLGAPVFRYHQHVPGDFLAAGTSLIQVTDDPAAATRAAVGEALVADPGAVMEALLPRLDQTAPTGEQPWSEPASAEDWSGTAHPRDVFATMRETLPADTVYVVESTSTNAAWWSAMDLRHPGSYFFPASGGLGFGLPAAVGVAMAHGELGTGRRVVAVIGDGSANYGITGLWSAAQLGLPVTFVLLRNGTYGALRWFADLLGVPDAPGMDVPGIDFVALATGYGVQAAQATDAAHLAQLLARDDRPSLIQVDTELTTPS